MTFPQIFLATWLVLEFMGGAVRVANANDDRRGRIVWLIAAGFIEYVVVAVVLSMGGFW